MNETSENLELTTQNGSQDLLQQVIGLGAWMGRREAFGLMAGRCAAADIECLRRMRDERKYRELNCTWAEFCVQYLKVSRRSVDRLIGHLEEFGPAYFHLTKLTHISLGEYRQIAAAVSEAGLEVNGSVVALLPENSTQLATAITELLERADPPQQTAPKAASMPPEPSPAERVIELCAQASSLLLELGPVEETLKQQVVSATWTLVNTARRTGYFASEA